MKCVVDQEDDRLNRSENNEIIAEYYQVINNLDLGPNHLLR